MCHVRTHSALRSHSGRVCRQRHDVHERLGRRKLLHQSTLHERNVHSGHVRVRQYQRQSITRRTHVEHVERIPNRTVWR
jgi:hypothetical protein